MAIPENSSNLGVDKHCFIYYIIYITNETSKDKETRDKNHGKQDAPTSGEKY